MKSVLRSPSTHPLVAPLVAVAAYFCAFQMSTPGSSSGPARQKHGEGRGPNVIPDAPMNPEDRILIRIKPPPDFGDQKVVKTISQLCMKGWPEPAITWAETPMLHKNRVWQQFQKIYKWDVADHDTISSLFWLKCKERCKDNLNKEQNKALKNASIDHPNEGELHMKEYKPWWCDQPIWDGMVDKWWKDDWKKMQSTASKNRAAGAPDGRRAPPTWRGGSISQIQHFCIQEAQSQGQPIDWLEVYLATRQNMPDAVQIADQYKALMDARYPEGSERPSINQELWERASVVKKNYIKGQGQRRKPSYSGSSSSSSQATQSSPYPPPPPQNPIDIVRAICRDQSVLAYLGQHLASLAPEDLAAAVSEAAAHPDPSEPHLDG